MIRRFIYLFIVCLTTMSVAQSSKGRLESNELAMMCKGQSELLVKEHINGNHWHACLLRGH